MVFEADTHRSEHYAGEAVQAIHSTLVIRPVVVWMDGIVTWVQSDEWSNGGVEGQRTLCGCSWHGGAMRASCMGSCSTPRGWGRMRLHGKHMQV
jgi:hypothetical protein